MLVKRSYGFVRRALNCRQQSMAHRGVLWSGERRSILPYSTLLPKPTYAGAYAFGRAVTETCVENGHIRKKQKKLNAARAREQWLVLIKDHHEGYITWQEYEDNQFRESAPEKSNSLSAESTTPHATRCWRRNERLCEGGQGIIVFDTVTGSETVKDDGYMVSRVDRVSEEPGGH